MKNSNNLKLVESHRRFDFLTSNNEIIGLICLRCLIKSIQRLFQFSYTSLLRLKDVVIKVAPGSMELVGLEKLKKLLRENPYTSAEMPDCGLY
ncbi:hypothetical protein Hanom_Chr12g01073231 [Helianthus anomalus]